MHKRALGSAVALLLGSAVALLLAFAPGAAARSTFAITGARCVPPENCTGAAHDVAPGGKLALRGRGLKRGMLVVFKRGSGRTITSKLRRSKYGSIVTVPPL